MADKQQDGSEKNKGTQPNLDFFREEVVNIIENYQNDRFEEGDRQLTKLAAFVETVDGSEKQRIRSYFEPFREYILGLRQFLTDNSLKGQEEVLDHLTSAKYGFYELSKIVSGVDKRGALEMTKVLEPLILQVESRIATLQGKGDMLATISKLIFLEEERIKNMAPDDSDRPFAEAKLIHLKTLPKLQKGFKALAEMNLDLSEQYLKEAYSSCEDMKRLYRQIEVSDLLAKNVLLASDGYASYIQGRISFVITLRKAILGDVAQSDIKVLEEAERTLIDGADMISRASSMMPGVLGGIEIESKAKTDSQSIKNLRELVQRKLKPEQIIRNAAPMAVIYFIGSFLVLIFALPMSGLIVAELNSGTITVILVVSLLISVIGAFGLESPKLVPLFEPFKNWLSLFGGGK